MTGFYQTRIYNQTRESQMAKLILQSSALVPKQLLTFDSNDRVRARGRSRVLHLQLEMYHFNKAPQRQQNYIVHASPAN